MRTRWQHLNIRLASGVRERCHGERIPRRNLRQQSTERRRSHCLPWRLRTRSRRKKSGSGELAVLNRNRVGSYAQSPTTS